jgi:hypothetical protein
MGAILGRLLSVSTSRTAPGCIIDQTNAGTAKGAVN